MKYIKYIPWLILLLIAFGVSVYFYQQTKSMEKLLKARNNELMQANLKIGRARTKLVNAESTIRFLDKSLKAEIKERHAIIALYSDLRMKYEAEKKKVKTLTRVIYKNKNTDRIIDLPKGKIFIRLDDGSYQEVTSMQWNYKDFRIDIEGDAIKQVLSYKLHQKFRGQFVETKLPTGGKNHYAKFYELNDEGKDVGEMELTKFDVLRSEDLPDRMMWINPKIDIMFGMGVSQKLDFTWLGEIGISLSAYGKTSDDIRWRFFRFGAGATTNGFSTTFSPVQFNIAKHLPLVSNLWLSPYGGYDFGSMNAHFGLGTSIVF